MIRLPLEYVAVHADGRATLLAFVAALVLAGLLAFVYERTFQGLAYSRTLVQTIVLVAVVACLLMIVVGDSIARGIGIIVSLAVIRFRTNLRDPRDLVFLFAAVAAGVACGTGAIVPAAVGTLLFSVTAAALYLSPLGARRTGDGLVRFQLPAGRPTLEASGVVAAGTRRFALVTMRDAAQGSAVEYAYQVTLRRPGDAERLIAALETIDGIRGLTYVNQETTFEV